MIGVLPKSLDVGGKRYGINSDFRIVLNLFEVLQLDELSNLEKAYITVKCIYTEEIPDKDFEEAVKKAYWFCDGGDSRICIGGLFWDISERSERGCSLLL